MVKNWILPSYCRDCLIWIIRYHKVIKEVYNARHPPAQFQFDPEKKTLVVLGTGWGATSFLKDLETDDYNVVY